MYTNFLLQVELNGLRGFAFVDYDSAASVQECLASIKEAPLELLGAALKVSIYVYIYIYKYIYTYMYINIYIYSVYIYTCK
jgi:hypothetical protein